MCIHICICICLYIHVHRRNASHGVGRGVNISTFTTGNDVVLFTNGSDGSVGFITNSLERMRVNIHTYSEKLLHVSMCAHIQ